MDVGLDGTPIRSVSTSHLNRTRKLDPLKIDEGARRALSTLPRTRGALNRTAPPLTVEDLLSDRDLAQRHGGKRTALENCGGQSRAPDRPLADFNSGLHTLASDAASRSSGTTALARQDQSDDYSNLLPRAAHSNCEIFQGLASCKCCS